MMGTIKEKIADFKSDLWFNHTGKILAFGTLAFMGSCAYLCNKDLQNEKNFLAKAPYSINVDTTDVWTKRNYHYDWVTGYGSGNVAFNLPVKSKTEKSYGLGGRVLLVDSLADGTLDAVVYNPRGGITLFAEHLFDQHITQGSPAFSKWDSIFQVAKDSMPEAYAERCKQMREEKQRMQN